MNFGEDLDLSLNTKKSRIFNNPIFNDFHHVHANSLPGLNLKSSFGVKNPNGLLCCYGGHMRSVSVF